MSRAFFFGNMYLSSIQQGIQAGHVISDMFVKYNNGGFKTPIFVSLYDWAENHKTMILLNGGFSDNLHKLTEMFEDEDNPYPFTYFCETSEALAGAITSVGIVLPEKIYEGAKLLRCVPYTRLALKEESKLGINGEICEYTDWEITLMEEINKYKLAS